MTADDSYPTDPDLPQPPLPVGPDGPPDPDIAPEPLPHGDPLPLPPDIPVQDPALPTPGEIVPPVHA